MDYKLVYKNNYFDNKTFLYYINKFFIFIRLSPG